MRGTPGCTANILMGGKKPLCPCPGDVLLKVEKRKTVLFFCVFFPSFFRSAGDRLSTGRKTLGIDVQSTSRGRDAGRRACLSAVHSVSLKRPFSPLPLSSPPFFFPSVFFFLFFSCHSRASGSLQSVKNNSHHTSSAGPLPTRTNLCSSAINQGCLYVTSPPFTLSLLPSFLHSLVPALIPSLARSLSHQSSRGQRRQSHAQSVPTSVTACWA